MNGLSVNLGPRMDKEIKAKWIEALRSGKYKQGRTRLRTANDEFCCLGVLCEVMNAERVQTTFDDQPYLYLYGSSAKSASFLPKELADAAGIDGYGSIGKEIDGRWTLAGLNDHAGYTFEQIADVIEEHF
jgi:hypothetical protein